MTSSSRINDAIMVASRAYDIEPELIQAVIKAESSFNERAVSPAGAKGLMQLMPKTARYLGVDDIFNIEQNILGGTRYLKEMKEMFGSTRLALIAYNWGPGNLAKYGKEKAPKETRDYLRRVEKFYGIQIVAQDQKG